MLNQDKNERKSATNEYNIEINIHGTVNGNVAGINNGIMDSLISENSNGTTKHLSYLNIKDDNKEFYKFMTEELDTPKDGSLPYEHLIMYFKDAPESLQIALLQNICNICSQIDIIESYEVLEDFCVFLDQIDTRIILNEKVKSIHKNVKDEVERMLLEDMEDLWQGR